MALLFQTGPMKIALASATFPSRLTDNAGFPASYELAKALKDDGHDVLVMTFCDASDPEDQEGEVELDGIRVIRHKEVFDRFSTFQGLSRMQIFSWQSSRARALYLHCLKSIEEFSPDVVESQDFNALGFFFATEMRWPFVVRCYGPMSLLTRSGDIGDIPHADMALVEATEFATVAASDGAIAICHDIANWWSIRSGKAIDEFDIVRTPMTMPSVLPEKPAPSSSKPFPQVFFWGRVERQKGADVLIESLPRVFEQYPDARILIGGAETKEYGHTEPYADTMRARLKEFGLQDKVEFLGFLSRDRIKELVIESDICVFPSRYETACYACIEAMSYGGCCIGSRVGGLQEYCIDEQTGILFETGNPDSLADSIIRLSGDEELRTRLSKAGPEHVKTFCDPRNTAKGSIEAYKKAIERFKSPHARRATALKILGERLGYALEDAPSAQINFDVQDKHHPVLEETWQKGYKVGYERGFEEGHSRACGERSLSLGGALYSMARRAKTLAASKLFNR